MFLYDALLLTVVTEDLSTIVNKLCIFVIHKCSPQKFLFVYIILYICI